MHMYMYICKTQVHILDIFQSLFFSPSSTFTVCVCVCMCVCMLMRFVTNCMYLDLLVILSRSSSFKSSVWCVWRRCWTSLTSTSFWIMFYPFCNRSLAESRVSLWPYWVGQGDKHVHVHACTMLVYMLILQFVLVLENHNLT